MRLAIPPTPAAARFAPLAKARDELDRLRGEARAASEQLQQLRVRLNEARERDVAAFATAIREGRGEPSERHAEPVEAELAETQRCSEALAKAVEAAERETLELVEREREKWLGRQEKAVREARELLRQALERYVESRAVLADEQRRRLLGT